MKLDLSERGPSANSRLSPRPKNLKRGSRKEGLALLHGVLLGGVPDGKAEGNLVDDIRNVVDQIERVGLHTALQVAEEVAQRVDAPTGRDDDAHGLEGGLHVLANLVILSKLASLTGEDLEEDESPASHAHQEAGPRVDESSLTAVTGHQHGNSAKQQAPENASVDGWVHSREDQVELNHLQRHGDGPVNVSVDNWGASELDPVLAHVEVVHGCDQGH